jgi:hypothetical protein
MGALCGGKGLLDFAEAGATVRKGAKYEQPVVLSDFAAQWPSAKKSKREVTLIFASFVSKTKEVATPAMRRRSE